MCNCNKKKNIGNSENCIHKYQDIYRLNLRILDILQTKETDVLNDLSKQVRKWLRELSFRCPSDHDIELVINHIEKIEKGEG